MLQNKYDPLKNIIRAKLFFLNFFLIFEIQARNNPIGIIKSIYFNIILKNF